MTTVAKARLEALAHLVIVTALTLSLTSNVILFFGGARFFFSQDDAGIFFLISVGSWLALVVIAIALNIAGSMHHRFALGAMLLSLLGIFFSGSALPAVT